MTGMPGGFGQRLRALRLGAGLSQEELAEAAGVSVRALAYMERGHTTGPQRRTVQALARALGLDPDESHSLEAAAAPGRGRPRLPTGTAPGSAPAAATDPVAAANAGSVVPGILALPQAVGDFTARGDALATLSTLADTPPPTTCPPVVVVTGQPGLGKTAFAVRAAHHLAPRFPDGRLYLDLRAMDPEPVPPREALARLLAVLGVAGQALPQTVEDRAGLFRSLTASRRLLLVLDNAADETRIRPLLPTTGTTLTIVTSRNSLAGLEAVHRVELPLLRREEAVELLTRVIGPDRVTQEPQAARDLADQCAGLPLALRIAGQRLAARPQETLAKLAALLGREERRLDLLQAGDLKVRAAFALSHQQLDDTSRRLLRRCALAAGPDFSPETAALLTGIPLRDTQLGLEELCDRGLLQPHPTTERYRFHDLLRLFAAEQLTADDTPATQTAALDRTTDWMLARARAAALHFDAEHHTTPTGDPDPPTAPTGRDEARSWLEAERDQWLAALHHAHHADTAGWHRQVVDTAEAMHWFSDLTQHWPQWTDVFQHSAHSARALGSPREEATHLNYLAWAHSICAHNPTAALETANRALTTAQACGDRLQTGWALGYGAGALRRLGRTDEAITRLRASAACHHDNPTTQGRLAEVTTLNTLGETLRQHGHADEALQHHLHSLEICRRGIPGLSTHLLAVYRALTLRQLGSDYAALGRWQEAETPLRQALTAFDQADSPARSGPVQLELGRTLRHLNRPDEARTTLTTALHTLTTHHHPLQTEAATELHSLTPGQVHTE
ncbi:helix-turn-helix domain-containing protein [Streptomyces sp. CAU 1734]|uniref:helix-turn-helix domain-containing protein n=1 Tax=Streptomyces sp. CAU 1734 TaxID=3140360 RepID=UPI00326088B9